MLEIEDSALGEVPHYLMDFARRGQILLSIFLAGDFPTPKSSATEQYTEACWALSASYVLVLGRCLETQGAAPYRDVHPKALLPNDKCVYLLIDSCLLGLESPHSNGEGGLKHIPKEEL